MPGDALGVVDDGGSRLSVFSPAGIHLHSAPTPVIVDTLAGCLSDGSAVALGKAPRAAAQGYDTTSDVDQDRLVAFTLSQSPELVGVFVPLPQNTLRVQVDGTPIIFMNLPFAPITAVAAAGNVVYYTDGVHSVRILTPELVERGVLRLGSAPEPLSDAVRDRVIDSFAARAPPARQPEIVTAMKSSPNMPSTMPSFRRLLADAAGRLWAQRYRRPDDSVQTWYVFTPDGLAVSQVSVPDDLNVVSIGDDYLAGWSFMEVDGIRVRQVRIYELTSHTP
jgi:hypothetical protein